MSTFTTRTNVTINTTVDRSVSSADVESVLRGLAREYGVTLGDLTVTTAPAERTVSVDMTEAQYAAWQASNASTAGNTSA